MGGLIAVLILIAGFALTMFIGYCFGVFGNKPVFGQKKRDTK